MTVPYAPHAEHDDTHRVVTSAEHKLKPHRFSVTRVLVGGALAASVGVLGLALGLPLLAATAAGATVGCGAVVLLTTRSFPR